jgi:hypothetical protein
MVVRLGVWLIERVLEVILLGFLLYMIFGEEKRIGWVGPIQNIARNMLFVSYFVLFSGYAITTIIVALSARFQSHLRHNFANVALYIVHSSAFLISSDQSRQVFAIVVFGACIVALTSLVGIALKQFCESHCTNRESKRP